MKTHSAQPLAYTVPLWWLLLAVLTLSGCVSSTISSALVNIVALLMMPLIFSPDVRAGFRRDPFVILFAGSFLVIGIVLTANAREPVDLLQWFNFIPLILCLPVYVLARRLSSPRIIVIVLYFLLAGSAIACAVGFYDLLIRGVGRAEGFLTGAIIYGRLALMFGFLAGAGFFLEHTRWRFVFLAGPALGILATLMSASRGIVLIVPFLGLLYLICCLIGRPRRTWLLTLAGAVFICVGVVLIAAPFIDTQRLLQSFAQIGRVFSGGEGVDGSTAQRLVFYWAGWELFWQSPWIGHGWAAVPHKAFEILDAADYGGVYSRTFFHFHNDTIQAAVAGGIVGVLWLWAILAAPLAGAWAGRRTIYKKALFYSALVMVLTQFCSGLTDITFGYDMPTTAYAMLSALTLGLFGRQSLQPPENTAIR